MSLKRKSLQTVVFPILFLPVLLQVGFGGGASRVEQPQDGGTLLKDLLALPSNRFDPYRAALLLGGPDKASAELLSYLADLSASVARRTDIHDPRGYLAEAVSVVFGREGFRLAASDLPEEKLFFHKVLQEREGPEVALALVLHAALSSVAFPVRVFFGNAGYELVSGPSGGLYRLSVRTGRVAPLVSDKNDSLPGYSVLSRRQLVGRYAVVIGRAARREGDKAGAQKLLRIAWHLAPQQADLYAELGMLALGEWELARAERLFKRALGLDPTLRTALVGRADLLVREGRLQAAEAALNRIFSSDRNDFKGNLIRGELFLEREEYAAAYDQFRRLTARKPQSARAWVGLGLAALGRRDRPGARAALETAERLASSSPEALCALGRWWAEEDPEKALTYFREAIRANSKYAPAYYYRGLLYEERGLAQAALEDYRAYVSLVPDHPRSTELQGRIENLRKELSGQ